MIYPDTTRRVFRVDIDSSKINTFEDLEKILRALSNDLHAGAHDIYNDSGDLIGHYGTVRILKC